MNINMEKIDQYVKEGWIYERQHEADPLLKIYNYTPKTQYEDFWCKETLMCRGLIIKRHYDDDFILPPKVNTEGTIKARPFEKFFNYNQVEAKIPKSSNYTISKKMDGSLGILYFIDDIPHIATRGSFHSEQAIRGTEILRKIMNSRKIENLNKNFTYLFEIIYPENKIIVNYGGQENLILLGIIEIETGKYLSLHENNPGFDVVNILSNDTSFRDWEELQKQNIKNEEGYVVFWPKEKFMMKIKFDDYIKLHSLISSFSSKKIWEILKSGERIADKKDILDAFPDEDYKKIKQEESWFLKEYNKIEDECFIAKLRLPTNLPRKSFAEQVLKDYSQYSDIIFKIHDKKDYSEAIWKRLKPKGC